MHFKYLWGILFIGGVSVLFAQEPEELTLDAATALALENNLTLANSEIDLQKSLRESRNSWNNFLPSASASLRLSHTDRFISEEPEATGFASMAPTSDPLTLNMGVNLSLNLNASVVTDITTAVMAYQTGKISLNEAERQLISSVKKSFFALLAQEKNIEYLKSNLQTAEQQYRETEVGYRNGYVSEVSLLQSQVAYTSLQPTLSEAEVSLQNQKELFFSLIGFRGEASFIGDLEAETAERMAAASLLIEAPFDPTQRDDWQSLNLSIKRLEHSKTGTMLKTQTPTLNLGANWSSSVNDPFGGSAFDKEVWNDSLSLSIGVTIPIDSLIPGSSADVTIKGQRDELKKSRNQLSLLEDSTRNETLNLKRKLETTEQNIEAQRLSLSLAEKSYDATLEAYSRGTASLMELENARDKRLEAQQGLIRQQLNYINGYIDLNDALGGKE